MNILFVDRNTKIGGGSTYLRTLVPAISDQGHNCYLLAGRGSAYHQVSPAFSGVGSHPPIWALAGRAVSRALRQWKIDAVVTQTTRSAKHALDPCRKAGIPLVMNVHGRHGLDSCADAVEYASAVVAMNQGTADYVQSCCPGALTKTHVCPLPVDIARFAPRPEPRRDGLCIAHCCRLSRNQSTQAYVTIEAASALVSEIPDLSVAIVGGQGDRLRKLRHEAERLNEAHQRMFIAAPGQVDDPRRHLAEADVVIGGGYVALEALSMNRWVIGMASKGMWGLVDEDSFETAFDANFGGSGDSSSEVTVDALLPVLREALRRRTDEGQITWGHERVAETCAPSKVARQVLTICAEAIEQRG